MAAEPDLTIDGAQALLTANSIAERGTFLGELHEADRFEPDALWRLLSAVTVIAATPPEQRYSEAMLHAYLVQNYTLKSCFWHFSPFDGAEIENLPGEDLQNYLNRIEWVFDHLILQKPAANMLTEFDDELENPYEAQLAAALEQMGR